MGIVDWVLEKMIKERESLLGCLLFFVLLLYVILLFLFMFVVVVCVMLFWEVIEFEFFLLFLFSLNVFLFVFEVLLFFFDVFFFLEFDIWGCVLIFVRFLGSWKMVL